MKLSCMQEAEKNFVVQSCFQCFNHLWLFTLQTHRRANKLECLLYTVLNFLACCDHSDFVIKCSVLLKRQNAISLMLDLSVLFFFFLKTMLRHNLSSKIWVLKFPEETHSFEFYGEWKICSIVCATEDISKR